MGERQDKAEALFKEGYNCSQSVLGAFADVFNMDEELAFKISSSFGAGMGRMREVCGAVSGMFMVIGLISGATEGKDVEAKKANYDFVQEAAEKFKEQSGGSIICKELLGLTQQKEFTETSPEQRNDGYYKERPCVELVREAAGILEEYLEKKDA